MQEPIKLRPLDHRHRWHLEYVIMQRGKWLYRIPDEYPDMKPKGYPTNPKKYFATAEVGEASWVCEICGAEVAR